MAKPGTRKSMKKRRREIQRDFINSLSVGEFKGGFKLEWIRPQIFHYIPDADPFRFTHKNENGQDIEIIPGEMETDGGSVPRALQSLPNLQPWEYGPAYMIHDWEFTLNAVKKNGHDIPFNRTRDEVNYTLICAIYTLMKKGYQTYIPAKKDFNITTLQLIDTALDIGNIGLWKSGKLHDAYVLNNFK